MIPRLRSAAFSLTCGGAFLSALWAAGRSDGAPPVEAAAPPPVVIPFDFQSQFDEGHYGRIVGDLLWKKLRSQGGCIVPESMDDVRTVCESLSVAPNPQTPLAEMRTLVREQFAADLAVWGSVERVAGTQLDQYDVTILVVDFRPDPPVVLHEETGRTQAVSEIPHVFVKHALAVLDEQSVPAAVAATPEELDLAWQRAEPLFACDFEQGEDRPAGWGPLTDAVQWLRDAPPGEGQGGWLRFAVDQAAAETTGILYYSDEFPVEEGALYRLQCRWRSDGPTVKIFVKCYDELPTRFRQRGRQTADREHREVYRSQQNLRGPLSTWNVHTQDFTPTHTEYEPRWGRIMLYAYYPAGQVDWDDVVVKQLLPAPTGDENDPPRRSSESDVPASELDQPGQE